MAEVTKSRVLFLLEEANRRLLAIFPDVVEKKGFVQCYSQHEEHSTAQIEYYKKLPLAKPHQYKLLYEELTGRGYNLEVLNSSDEPIKSAFTSPSREGRTIIVYKDGGVKVFDQGDNWDTQATVVNFEPSEIEGDKLLSIVHFDQEEINEIQQAVQAP